MRPSHLPDGDLTAADVPHADDPVAELLAFGHRFHAYRVAGSLPRVARIAVEVHDRWIDEHAAAPEAVLDEPLQRLRIALFHTARAATGGGAEGEPDDETTEWLRVLVRSVGARLHDRAQH